MIDSLIILNSSNDETLKFTTLRDALTFILLKDNFLFLLVKILSNSDNALHRSSKESFINCFLPSNR